MGLIAFLIYVVIVVLFGWVAVWVIGKLAPGHPVIIDNIIWVVVVLLIVLMLVQATGLLGHDSQIPRLR